MNAKPTRSRFWWNPVWCTLRRYVVGLDGATFAGFQDKFPNLEVMNSRADVANIFNNNVESDDEYDGSDDEDEPNSDDESEGSENGDEFDSDEEICQ